MRKKKLAALTLSALAFTLLSGVGIASANGMWNATPEDIAERHTLMWNEQASLLGVSVDEIKSAWASGKNLKDLAEEKGISEDVLKAKMKEARTVKMKEQLSYLVQKGVITQAQADARLSTMEKMFNGTQFGRKGGNKGMGFGPMGM